MSECTESMLKIDSDWESLLASGSKDSAAFARTVSPFAADEGLCVEYAEDGVVPTIVLSNSEAVRPASKSRRKKDLAVRVRIKLRIDSGKTYELYADRMVAPNGSWKCALDSRFLGSKFFKKLAKGSMLRVRTYIDDEASTTVFSLSGAAQALRRAQMICRELGSANEFFRDDEPIGINIRLRKPFKEEEEPQEEEHAEAEDLENDD